MVRAMGGAGRREMCGARGENPTFEIVLRCVVHCTGFVYIPKGVEKNHTINKKNKRGSSFVAEYHRIRNSQARRPLHSVRRSGVRATFGVGFLVASAVNARVMSTYVI